MSPVMINTIMDIPPHKPSNPSIRFTALVIPTIHPRVTIKAIE